MIYYQMKGPIFLLLLLVLVTCKPNRAPYIH